MALRPETERWIAVVAFGLLAAYQIPVVGGAIAGFMQSIVFSNITIANVAGVLGAIEAVRMVHNGGHF